jgi:hypothetical protein
MRLWSIHPKYLDTKGLVALWREALLAKKVLQNRTKGYKKHPQLNRFRDQLSSVNMINLYLAEILKESRKRNYNFDAGKVGSVRDVNYKIPVTTGQVQFEYAHLMKKLKKRDMAKYHRLKGRKKIETHPLFELMPGKIEEWEKL